MKVQFEVSESHSQLWTNNEWRYGIIMGGRGNGRSGTASRYTISQLLGKEYFRGVVMRAVQSDIDLSCWAELEDLIISQGIQNEIRVTEDEMTCGLKSVRPLGFRASKGSLTARLKSLAGFNFVWSEEAEEVGEEEFRKLDDTLRTVKGRIRIILTLNTPTRNHWILQKWFDLEESKEAPGFYIPKLKPEFAKDVLFIGGTWEDNKPNIDKHTAERYEGYRYTNPAYYWQVIRGLAPDEVRGKIFSGWQTIDTIPQGARLMRIGVDWGWFPDPTVAVAMYYHNGSYIFDELAYDTQLEDEVLAKAIKDVPGWQQTPAICGADEPKSIETLRKYHIPSRKTDNRAGSVQYRIKVASAKKIYITRRSKKLWESYENYHWAEDKDGRPTGQPDHYLSDGMDACTYALADISPIAQQGIINSPPRARVNIAV